MTKIKIKFLGKDSVPFEKVVDLPQQVVDNLREFIAEGNETIFGNITSGDVNEFLGQVLEGLTAKVFRTFIATKTVKDYLDSETPSENAQDIDKVFIAKKANLQAAIALNHKRAVPKNYDEKLAEKKTKLKEMKKEGKDEEDTAYRKLDYDIFLTEKTRDVALSTSLTNYIDPRVFFAYCDKVELPITKLYSKTLLKKMSWALQREEEDEV